MQNEEKRESLQEQVKEISDECLKEAAGGFAVRVPKVDEHPYDRDTRDRA